MAHAVRIDAHLHFWRYNASQYSWIDDSMAALRRDFLPDDAAGEMRAAGIDACVVVQTRQTLEETRWLLALARQHPFIAGVVGWVDLRAADLDAHLEALSAHQKLVGIRHIVQAEPDDFLLGDTFRRGVARLARHGLAYDILVYARQLRAAIDFAGALPDQRLVLDHLGKPDIRTGAFDGWRRDLDRLAALPNVCAKLSGLVTEADWRHWAVEDLHRYINAALDSFGPERLMIGSDWPVCTVAGGYGDVLDVVRTAIEGRPPREREAVLGGTAQRFWNLSDESSMERIK
ncbi:MAG: amidohydrolase family protein [Acidobacteriota bacterium]|nr:amidohydrolase family protein [Acidobacteriota bacterium]